MIQINEKQDCCGCEACAQICPQGCIRIEEDHESFLYPKIDTERCTECALCEKSCPVLHQSDSREPLAVYAAKNRDEEIRRQSSSGGVFTLLAEQTIHEGGLVFGAKFNADWDVVHDYTKSIEGLDAFRGSKYVQSRIGNTFAQAKQFLKDGRKVLFSGTPCQIAGLKLYLRKEYENLLTVDFICHGVPSPMVWRRYKQELLSEVRKNTVSTNGTDFFTAINFRNKTEGWKKFSFAATVRCADGNSVSLRTSLHENIYMRGFLRDLYLRPSCHACPAKSLKSGSDITIADFWGIQQFHSKFDDDRGTSLVIANSKKGALVYGALSLESIPTTKQALQSVLFHSAKPHFKRGAFFEQIDTAPSLTLLIEQLTQTSLFRRFTQKGVLIAKRVLKITLNR